MPSKRTCSCSKIAWKGRSGWRLSNGLIEIIVLTGGGHLASLRRVDVNSPNLLFEATWKTIEPFRYRVSKHKRLYGPRPAGPFLGGFTGHAVALGYFGAPSDLEIAAGLPLHGEAASLQWRILSTRVTRKSAHLEMAVQEPAMQLSLVRELTIHAGESLVHIRERVTNNRKSDNFLQWVQHATFGEPLLSPTVSRITIPAIRGCTWPLGYEGKSLLMDKKSFQWPAAPMQGGGTTDLSRAFISEGTGFVAAALIDTSRLHGFVAVSNPKIRLAAGYWFPRSTYPWVTLWEENRARDYAPWNGSTQSRGLEFGTTPFPLGLAKAVQDGPMFNTPTLLTLGPYETKSLDYAVFACELPGRCSVEDIRLRHSSLELISSEPQQRLVLGEVHSQLT